MPLLKDITTDINIRDLAGKRVAIDAYVWLHEKIFCCARELAMGKDTTTHITSFVRECKQLINYGVTPVVVFDGASIRLKRDVNNKRRQQRSTAGDDAAELESRGDLKKAYKKWASCVDVTPQMAHEVMRRLDKIDGVEYMVAPYEADPQLAFLFLSGDVYAVISVDSDLLTFGVRRLITKYKCKEKKGKLVDLNNLTECRSPIDMRNVDSRQFVALCIFLGCDYVDRIRDLGPKRIFSMLSMAQTWRQTIALIRQSSYKNKVPADYERQFKQVSSYVCIR